MQVRLECTLEELTGNWVEVAALWTRAEMRRWNLAVFGVKSKADATPEQELFTLLQEKLAAVHIYLPDGTLLADSAQLVARFDDLDVRLVRWLASGISQALQELLALGEARKRLLFDGVAVAAPTTGTPGK